MEKNYLFYQESGNTQPLKQILSYALCIISALILGYFYTILIVFIPLIYLNVLVPVGFGIVLGFIYRFVVRISKNRNKKSRLILAISIGILANYFQWTAYILYAFYGNIPSFTDYISNLYWIAVPSNFFTAISEINSVGMWSVFGITFNGFFLTLIWIVEALFIMAGPFVAIYKIMIYPYSEFLNKWYPKYSLLRNFKSISTDNRLLTELASDPLSTLENIGKGTSLRHTKIHLYYLEEEEQQYLTFEKIYIEGKGKGKKSSTVVINNFTINKTTAQTILEKYDNKRERFEVI